MERAKDEGQDGPIAVCVLLVTLCEPPSTFADTNIWTRLGPDGVDVVALALAPGASETLYALTNQGVFKSMDAGALWTPVNAGLPTDGAVFQVAVDPVTPNVSTTHDRPTACRTWASSGQSARRILPTTRSISCRALPLRPWRSACRAHGGQEERGRHG